MPDGLGAAATPYGATAAGGGAVTAAEDDPQRNDPSTSTANTNKDPMANRLSSRQYESARYLRERFKLRPLAPALIATSPTQRARRRPGGLHAQG